MWPRKSRELLSPGLWPEACWRTPSRALAAASAEEQRRVVAAVVDAALTRNALLDDTADARVALQAGRAGDSGTREDLRLLAERLDELYFDAEDAGDAATSEREFRRARAASALWAVLDADAAIAVRDGLYEALHAIADDDEVLRLLHAQLGLAS